jgi:hypothetical protein
VYLWIPGKNHLNYYNREMTRYLSAKGSKTTDSKDPYWSVTFFRRNLSLVKKAELQQTSNMYGDTGNVYKILSVISQEKT